MKKLLLISIFFTLAIAVPLPTMASVDINAGISLPPTTVFEARPEVIMTPDIGGVFVADTDADAPKDSPTDMEEKQQGQLLETEQPTKSESRSNWKINVWPVKPRDNIKTPHEMKEENKHTPPDRFD